MSSCLWAEITVDLRGSAGPSGCLLPALQSKPGRKENEGVGTAFTTTYNTALLLTSVQHYYHLPTLPARTHAPHFAAADTRTAPDAASHRMRLDYLLLPPTTTTANAYIPPRLPRLLPTAVPTLPHSLRRLLRGFCTRVCPTLVGLVNVMTAYEKKA